MKVAQIMKSKGTRVVTVRPEATVADVAATLKREHIGAVIVTDEDGTVRGIISERDIVHAVPEHGPRLFDKTVADLMTRDVITCTPEHDLDHIRREMTSRRIRHIPVIADGRLAGIVSIGDVVKSRLEELETESHQLREYISSG